MDHVVHGLGILEFGFEVFLQDHWIFQFVVYAESAEFILDGMDLVRVHFLNGGSNVSILKEMMESDLFVISNMNEERMYSGILYNSWSSSKISGGNLNYTSTGGNVSITTFRFDIEALLKIHL